MKKVMILGAGNIGRAVAYDLKDEFEVHVGDLNVKALEEVEDFARCMILDVSDKAHLVDVLADFDLVIGTLPSRFGYASVEAAIEAGVDMVDISFMPEDPFELNENAEDAGVTVVVDAGFGPGMSNVFMGRIDEELDGIENCIIRLGGLPKDPEPPLFYKVTWSPYDLIEEYTRDARLIRGGEEVVLDPFDEINPVVINDMELEEFYSDGLRTLLDTVNADTMEETTLRWPGHLEKIKVLRELGFFEEENLDPTLKVILPLMKFDSPDISLLDVEAEGTVGDEKRRYHYFLYDEASEEFSSMSRCTGFTG
ncbi:MAG: saccharopine dehydrogenase C-terminal domain-containing protein, partial [Thermoplasmata archaeon]